MKDLFLRGSTALIIVWILGAAYTAGYVKRGWIPHDEGTFAHPAERVLAGELPHLDFDDTYTGGLAFINAFAFRFGGVDLVSPRLVLFGVFLLWLPVVFLIANRFVPPLAAGVVTLLAVVWSVPNYFATAPSWYNLFFATFGTAALLSYVDTDRRRWLVVAGLCGGASVLVKAVGFWYVGAGLLFLLFSEQCLSRELPARRPQTSTLLYQSVVAVGLLTYLALLTALLWVRLGITEFVHFLAPSLLVVVVLIFNELRPSALPSAQRFRNLARLGFPYLIGFILPILVFLVPYVVAGTLAPLLEGLFLKPALRLQFASQVPPSLVTLLPSVALALWLSADNPPGTVHPIESVVISLALLGCLVLAGTYEFVYRFAYYCALGVATTVVVTGAMFLISRRGKALSFLQRRELFLFISLTALCSMVQFPFTISIYFFYVAPLAILTIVVLWKSLDRETRFVHMAVLSFFLGFGVLWVNTAKGDLFTRHDQTYKLTAERGGLYVTRSDQEVYERLIALVKKHSRSEYIYAAPDCPEVYFLTGRKNPTRALYDFFDPSYSDVDTTLRTLTENRIDLVAINTAPQFSAVPDALLVALAEYLPHSQQVGKFIVRWRR